jgi:integrin alpha FG-GAP repeat containing protein 1
VPRSTLAQPIPIDANGDLKIDLLGTTPGSGQDALKLWKNVVDTYAVDPGPVFDV